jgi:hypothetical protein
VHNDNMLIEVIFLTQEELQGLASLFAQDIRAHTSMGIAGLHIDGIDYWPLIVQEGNQTLQKLRDFPAETLLICMPQVENKTCVTRELPGKLAAS